VVAPLEHAVATIQNIFEEVRRIYMDLRPALLDDLGIKAALSWFIREFQKGYPHIRIERDIDIDESNVPEPLKIVVYRVLQEAFINVAKHSKADRVHFALGRRDDRVEMTIKDNGEGFNVGQTMDVNHPRKGYGLLLMREKIEISGGSLKIISLDGGETVIRASWPIPRS
jgi:signal transduction histidine kinase